MTVTVRATGLRRRHGLPHPDGRPAIGRGACGTLSAVEDEIWLACEDRTVEQTVKMLVVELKADTIKSLDRAGSGSEVLSFRKLLLYRCVSEGRKGRQEGKGRS